MDNDPVTSGAVGQPDLPEKPDLSAKMAAIVQRAAGDSAVLEWAEVDVPAPGAHDLLVAVRAVSVNPVDVRLRASARLRQGEARILGHDAAGVVVAVGEAVTMFAPGDHVYYAGTIGRAGTNAAYHCVDERIVGRMPATLSFKESAALPLTAIAAWELLFDKLRLPAEGHTRPGTLLVINGAGGVGSMLIQLAQRLTGLTVIATASRPESAAWARHMGAHHIIDHRRPLDEGVREIGLKQADYVAGLAATDWHLPAIAKLIAPHGTMALIDDPQSLDIVPLRAKAVTVAWEGMFVRSLYRTPDMIEQHRLLNRVSALVDETVLRTTLHDDFGTISPESLARAHDHVASGMAIGKSVLTMPLASRPEAEPV